MIFVVFGIVMYQTYKLRKAQVTFYETFVESNDMFKGIENNVIAYDGYEMQPLFYLYMTDQLDMLITYKYVGFFLQDRGSFFVGGANDLDSLLDQSDYADKLVHLIKDKKSVKFNIHKPTIKVIDIV